PVFCAVHAAPPSAVPNTPAPVVPASAIIAFAGDTATARTSQRVRPARRGLQVTPRSSETNTPAAVAAHSADADSELGARSRTAAPARPVLRSVHDVVASVDTNTPAPSLATTTRVLSSAST